MSTVQKLAEALAALDLAVEPGSRSMQAHEPAPGILVINDCAEATPLSMANALKVLAELGLDGSRTIAILGELDDVGDDWRDEHDRIGRIVVRLNISQLVVVGQGARHIHNAAGLEGSWDGESMLVDTAEEAYAVVGKVLRAGDVVLVKSSVRAGLGSLADRLGGAVA